MAKKNETGKVNPSRPNKPDLKGARPIMTPDDTGRETPAPSGGNGGHSNGTVFGRVRDAASSVGSTVGGALTNGFRGLKNSMFGLKTVTASVSSGLDKMADYLHVPKKGLAAVLAIVLLGTGTTGGIMLVNYNAQQMILRQEDYYDECADLLADAKGAALPTTPAGNVNAQQEENAKKMWALGKALGFTDEQCAGMLGNMQQESGLDPTSVEGIFSEPYQFGSRKSALFPLPSGAMNAYVPGTLQPSYASNGISINLSAYKYDGTNYCCGIGMIQWTGPTAKGLIDFAEANGKQWYDLDIQCARLIQGESHRLEGFIADKGNASSVAGATASWLGFMERGEGHAVSSGYQYETRLSYANDWYARFSSQSESIASEFSEFANSVLSMAETAAGAATGSHVSKLQDECGTTATAADNSSLAAAAVAYAWETEAMGNGNNGTQLYQAVHDAMFPGDPWYQSCDRGVATAVVWSGADDNFPVGATSQQDAYLAEQAGKGLWEFVGEYDTVSDQLQPGDICITTSARRGTEHGHIIMYVGNEAIQQKYPGASGEFVSASYETRSPGCGSEISYYLGDGYHVYRYVGDYSGTKKNLYSGTASGTS